MAVGDALLPPIMRFTSNCRSVYNSLKSVERIESDIRFWRASDNSYWTPDGCQEQQQLCDKSVKKTNLICLRWHGHKGCWEFVLLCETCCGLFIDQLKCDGNAKHFILKNDDGWAEFFEIVHAMTDPGAVPDPPSEALPCGFQQQHQQPPPAPAGEPPPNRAQIPGPPPRASAGQPPADHGASTVATVAVAAPARGAPTPLPQLPQPTTIAAAPQMPCGLEPTAAQHDAVMEELEEIKETVRLEHQRVRDVLGEFRDTLDTVVHQQRELRKEFHCITDTLREHQELMASIRDTLRENARTRQPTSAVRCYDMRDCYD